MRRERLADQLAEFGAIAARLDRRRAAAAAAPTAAAAATA